jgi:uncharacterized linocin/CFP29 family protein
MPSNLIVDGMINGVGSGDLAALNFMTVNNAKPFIGEDGRAYVNVFKGGDPKDVKNYTTQLTTHATLRRDEWKHLDEAVLMASRDRLVGIQDLRDNGLVYNLPNPMGSTVLETHKVDDPHTAEMTMDGVTRTQGDRPDFSTEYIPIPIIHVDYEINARVLASSRNLGNPLDTTNAESAARRIAEYLEDLLFTNTTYAYGGGTIYSYISHPNNNDVTLATAWDDSAKTAAQIRDDVLSMKQASIDAKHYGPWMLYIPTSWETSLDEDYDDTRGNTIRQRLQAIEGIMGIKVADRLPADNAVLVQMKPNTVRLIDGLPIQNIEWKVEGNFLTKYKVMTIQVPQIRADKSGNCGVTLLS